MIARTGQIVPWKYLHEDPLCIHNIPSQLSHWWRASGQNSALAWRKPEERRQLINARMATADHDRQGQAAHRRYKSRPLGGKSVHKDIKRMYSLSSFIDRKNGCMNYSLPHWKRKRWQSVLLSRDPVYPVFHDIKSEMHCLLGLAPSISHLTSCNWVNLTVRVWASHSSHW